MKMIRTRGRGAQQAVELLASLEQRGGAALDTVLPTVKRIVIDVRRRGDRALLRYATQFDGLAGIEAMRVTTDEMAASWNAISPADARGGHHCCEADSRFCRESVARFMVG